MRADGSRSGAEQQRGIETCGAALLRSICMLVAPNSAVQRCQRSIDIVGLQVGAVQHLSVVSQQNRTAVTLNQQRVQAKQQVFGSVAGVASRVQLLPPMPLCVQAWAGCQETEPHMASWRHGVLCTEGA